MKIAILGGTGSIGEGFALRWAEKHEILVCSREIERAVNVACDYRNILSNKGIHGCEITGCGNEAAIKEADVVVLSVPYQGVVSLLEKLSPLFKDQIVISLVVPMKKNKWFEFTPQNREVQHLRSRKFFQKP